MSTPRPLGVLALSLVTTGHHSSSPPPGKSQADICWLETVTIELLIYFLEEMNLHDCHLLIHSNNQGTIGAFDKGCSPNSHLNLSIHHTYLTLSHLSISPQIIYVESIANPADPISRREQGDVDKYLPHDFKLPDELIDSFIHV